jgi:hypothetical protein
LRDRIARRSRNDRSVDVFPLPAITSSTYPSVNSELHSAAELHLLLENGFLVWRNPTTSLRPKRSCKPMELACRYGGHTEWRHRPFVGTSVEALDLSNFSRSDRASLR